MKRLLASTALMLTLALPAMAQDYTPDPNAKPGGSITVTYKDDVATLDPAIGYDWQNWSMIKSLFDGMMDYVPGTTTLRPGLAESYALSEDGLTYTFKLRPGVKFHNGREMTAEDVKYSLDRVTNPATQSPGAGFFGSITAYGEDFSISSFTIGADAHVRSLGVSGGKDTVKVAGSMEQVQLGSNDDSFTVLAGGEVEIEILGEDGEELIGDTEDGPEGVDAAEGINDALV